MPRGWFSFLVSLLQLTMPFLFKVDLAMLEKVVANRGVATCPE